MYFHSPVKTNSTKSHPSIGIFLLVVHVYAVWRTHSMYPCSCFGDTHFKSLIMVLGMMVEPEHRVVSDKVWVKRFKMHTSVRVLTSIEVHM